MSPRTPRRRLAEGVYRDRYSLTGKVQVGARVREKAFPPDTPIREIQKWREITRGELHKDAPIVQRGTLDADVTTYLARMAKRPASLPAKRSELKAWQALYGSRATHTLTPADMDTAIAAWLEQQVAPKTIVNRCRTLHHLLVTLADDPRARTPLDTIRLPDVPKRRPAYVDAATIRRVEKALRGDPIARARFMVLASTGIRPSQLMRLTAADVDWKRRLVIIPGGKGGEPIVFALNRDMLAAWHALRAANAWGEYDTSQFAKRVRKAGWPADVRVYNAKHSLGIDLAEGGADADDIRAWFGHTDHSTTRIYTGVPLARMAKLSQRLEGRLGWGAPRTTPRGRDGKKSRKDKSGGKSTGTKKARSRA